MASHTDTETLAVVPQKTPIELGPRGIELNTLSELGRFAQIVLESGLAPESLDTLQKIILALELGMELGFRPMQALANIGVINGRAGIYGDAAKALCEASGLMIDYKQRFEGSIKDGTRKWIVESLRKGRKEYLVTEYSIDDAKTAELWGKLTKTGKPTPWVTAPDRMLMFRARGFNLRDNFPDVLKGFKTYEELEGYTPEVDPADHETRLKRAKPARVAEPKFESPKEPEKFDPAHDETQPGLFAPKSKPPPKERKEEAPPPAEESQKEPEKKTPGSEATTPPKKLRPYVELRTRLLELKRTPEDFVALCVDREAIPEPRPFEELEEDLVKYAVEHWDEVKGELASFTAGKK
jgi:hypothetical protein